VSDTNTNYYKGYFQMLCLVSDTNTNCDGSYSQMFSVPNLILSQITKKSYFETIIFVTNYDGYIQVLAFFVHVGVMFLT